MDLNRSIRFCKMLEGKPIDYIEQTIESKHLEDIQELAFHTEILIAVDESVTDIDSVHRFLEYQCADVFVLKPMTIGGNGEQRRDFIHVNDMVDANIEGGFTDKITFLGDVYFP